MITNEQVGAGSVKIKQTNRDVYYSGYTIYCKFIAITILLELQ